MSGQLLSKRAAARYLGVGMETLNGYLDAGLIPVFHDPMRDRDRIPRPALDAWLAGFRPEGVAS
jgi:hypothetical protein